MYPKYINTLIYTHAYIPVSSYDVQGKLFMLGAFMNKCIHIHAYTHTYAYIPVSSYDVQGKLFMLGALRNTYIHDIPVCMHIRIDQHVNVLFIYAYIGTHSTAM
jgi:hypothetical protein